MLVKTPFHDQTRDIIAAAIEVHRVLGPGLLESAYSRCLQYELSARRMAFVTERRVPLVYKLVINFNVDQLVKGVRRVVNPCAINGH